MAVFHQFTTSREHILSRSCFLFFKNTFENEINVALFIRLTFILSDGTDLAYAYVDFNYDGTLLASIGGNPDHTLTIWNWKEEQPILRTKAFSQEVFKVTFNPDNDEQLTTSGSGHIK